MIETIVPAMIGAAGSILQNKVQNEQSKQNIEHAAAVNYGYGEMSADNAQARTKALYSELYSPEAMYIKARYADRIELESGYRDWETDRKSVV